MTNGTFQSEFQGGVRTVPRLLLRIEGLAMFAVSIVIYRLLGHPWWLFMLLVLLPDIGMAGYAINRRVGAITYNGLHTYLGPAIIAGAGYAAGETLPLSIAVIWSAHIGFDRMLGYGFKYATGFSDTHLGPIGKSRPLTRGPA